MEEDLLNATKATCKGAAPKAAAPTKKIPLPPNLPKESTGANVPKADPVVGNIYDDVIHQVGAPIRETEHQVTQQAEGEVNPSAPPKAYYLQSSWVELPNCTGHAGETPLAHDLANATVATCKSSPGVDPKAVQKADAAAAANASVTPKPAA